MTYTLTPQQFSSLQNKLVNMKGVVLRPANQLSGVIEYRGVTLGYSYDGKAALSVDIQQKHGFAGLMSDEKIYDTISADLVGQA